MVLHQALHPSSPISVSPCIHSSAGGCTPVSPSASALIPATGCTSSCASLAPHYIRLACRLAMLPIIHRPCTDFLYRGLVPACLPLQDLWLLIEDIWLAEGVTDSIWLQQRTVDWRSIRVHGRPDGRTWLIWLECRTASDWSRFDEALAWFKASSAARTIEALHL